MKFFLPKGQTLRVFLPDTWIDFHADDTPLTAYFEGGGCVLTHNQDKTLLGAWGPRQFLKAEIVK